MGGLVLGDGVLSIRLRAACCVLLVVMVMVTVLVFVGKRRNLKINQEEDKRYYEK